MAGKVKSLVDVSKIDVSKIDVNKLNEILGGTKNPFLSLVKAISPSDINIRTPQESAAANIRILNLQDKVSSLSVDSKPFLTQLALNTYDLLNPTLQTSIDTTILNFNSNSNDLANISNPFPITTQMNTEILNLSLNTTPLTFLDLLLQQLVQQIEDTNSKIRARADKAEKQAKLAKGAGIAGAAGDLLNSFLPEKTEYSGKRGAITAGLDSAYDQLADAANQFGPIGNIVSGFMKANAGVNKVVNLLGGGTSGMTTWDALAGSSFLPGIGWINGWGGRTTSTITKDNEAFAQVGSSYGGTENTVDEALEVSGKKYGLLSNSARRKAERQLAEARRLQSIIQGISDDAQIRSTLQGTMSDILSNRYGLLLQGGYDLRAIHVGKRGLKVSPYKARRLTSNITFKFYQKGGPVTKNRSLKELYEYAREQNPRFIQRLFEDPTLWIETPDGHPGSHLLSYVTDDYGNAYVFPTIMEDENGKLKNYDDEAEDIARERGDYLKMSPEEALFFTSNYKYYIPNWMKKWNEMVTPYVDENGKVKHEVEKEQQGTKIASHIEPTDLNLIITTFKEGGIIPSKVETIIEPVLIITEVAPLELELIESFLNGGEINIIPDGALHKNLHHMEDAEHLTKKGIPVVAIDNNELVAEIERSEIILRLEVTEKLEELCKLYYSEDATKKEKDEYALEAGELLVDEILNNTIDNTNKLL